MARSFDCCGCPVGRAVRRCLVAASLTAAMTLSGPSTARAAVTCGSLEGFSRLVGGELYRLRDASLLTAANTLSEVGVVGRGWGSFAWAGAGGDGVVYALTTAGKLVWYRWNPTAAAWMTGSGSVIGTGFIPGSRVVNIAVGIDGWIYTVRPDGKLVVYQHLGRLTGAASWSTGVGYVLGSGWTANELIVPQGDGTVYRQWGGDLYWYRHSSPAAGRVVWNNGGRGVKIGAGWRFYDLLPLGGGVLLATSAPSGQVTVWQHADPMGGGQGWAVVGVKKYLARLDSFGVLASPDICS
jgi:hypothetical protein